MGRPKKAVAFIEKAISELTFQKDFYKILGMIELAEHLAAISETESFELFIKTITKENERQEEKIRGA